MAQEDTHADIQAPMKPLLMPLATTVATPDTSSDMNPESSNPKTIGSSRLGKNGFIAMRFNQAQGRLSASCFS